MPQFNNVSEKQLLVKVGHRSEAPELLDNRHYLRLVKDN